MGIYQPIDCALHDQLEVCCLYHYDLKLATKDGRIVRGTAKTTLTDDEKREWLLLRNDAGDQRIAMDSILQLDVLTPDAKVGHLRF